MIIEKTCGNCKELFVGGIPPRMPIMACKITDNIIPHEWNGEKFTMWRIPTSCPRTSGVHKSEKQAPKKEWVIKTLEDFKSVK